MSKKRGTGLRISPIAHGQHDNIWFNIKNGSLTMKVTGFYDTGLAYVQKTIIKNKDLDKAANFKRIKDKLEDKFDFVLVTPFEEAFKPGIKFDDTKALLDKIQKLVENE